MYMATMSMLFKEMVDDGIGPEIFALNSIIKGYVLSLQEEEDNSEEDEDGDDDLKDEVKDATIETTAALSERVAVAAT
ncbi:hypothetical protein L1887_11214 [Cichorium endivia]|nr:hypothetical protein L1887_11214 [Cichorium endivia]